MYDSKLVKKFVSQGKENADEKCLLIKKHKIQKKIIFVLIVENFEQL